VGDVGVASTIKIINNLLAASHVALTAEALSFGAKAGVPLDKLIQVISSSSGASQMFLNRARRMVSGDHDVHASVSTFLKDLNIAMDSADDLGSPVPVSRAAREVFMAASAAGLEGSSDTKLFDFYGAAMQLRHGQ
jgi:3-hydroxyisobutyrate dehydrogenase